MVAWLALVVSVLGFGWAVWRHYQDRAEIRTLQLRASIGAVIESGQGQSYRVRVRNGGPGRAFLRGVERIGESGIYRQTIDLTEPVELLGGESIEVARMRLVWQAESRVLRLVLTWTDETRAEPWTRDQTLTP